MLVTTLQVNMVKWQFTMTSATCMCEFNIVPSQLSRNFVIKEYKLSKWLKGFPHRYGSKFTQIIFSKIIQKTGFLKYRSFSCSRYLNSFDQKNMVLKYFELFSVKPPWMGVGMTSWTNQKFIIKMLHFFERYTLIWPRHYCVVPDNRTAVSWDWGFTSIHLLDA